MNDLKKQLNEDLNVATWEMLKPHLKRGALVEIHESLDLVEVCMAVAQDKAEIIKDWMDKGLVKNVDEKYFSEQEGLKFKFLILSPYVLMQILKETN